MLELKKIKKEYVVNDFKQNALNGVSLKFRNNEFVSILGPSGSGKTTLLNIVGGLDSYTSGDLLINGVSTKKYKDIDWDTYRNHHVGFVFQSYNLITHQTVLANVELALTISGVNQKERRVKALEVLEKVGLKDHTTKKPNQLSGGQMQRVAIARALINDPDILLADEPTGALDTETSVQIMGLLKEIANDKLVIMVTHNPELAEEYSTRIVKVLDGDIISDSKPYTGKDNEDNKSKKGKKFMSFRTALNLSFNNLLTKKGRTLMTAFAGSIGIIGIATILSLSNGVQEYINKVEEDTLSSYPLTITETSVDASSIITSMSGFENAEVDVTDGIITSNDMISQMLNIMTSELTTNNLTLFKDFIETDEEINKYLNTVQYSYNLDLQLYVNSDTDVIKVNPSDLFTDMSTSSTMMTTSDIWVEMFDNQELVESQYELLAGTWATGANEVLILVDENNQISDYTLYTLGLKDQSEIEDMMNAIMMGETFETAEQESYTYDELLDLSFKLVLNTDYYEQSGSTWIDQSDNTEYMLEVLSNALEIEVVGIVKAGEDTSSTIGVTGGVLYTSDLTSYVIENINSSDIATAQLNNPEVNVLTGLSFEDSEDFNINDLSAEEQAYLATLTTEELQAVLLAYSENTGVSYEEILLTLGIVDIDSPSVINLYSKDFDAKESLEEIISQYNETQDEENQITYTDYVGLMMSSVTTIIDMITYVLIAFVSISLIVSSIMIGIITYISVLERTKEIGILRAIGASRKDISRVFNAETFIVGLFSGILGIGVTLIINMGANIIIEALTGVANIALLPLSGAVALIVISVTLTLLAGLIPSNMASKKNPVEALRTE